MGRSSGGDYTPDKSFYGEHGNTTKARLRKVGIDTTDLEAHKITNPKKSHYVDLPAQYSEVAHKTGRKVLNPDPEIQDKMKQVHEKIKEFAPDASMPNKSTVSFAFRKQ